MNGQCINEVKRGEIYFVNFGTSINNKSRKQQGLRPGVVISNNLCNSKSDVITVVALTSNVEKALAKKLPTQVFISKQCGLQSDSIALCEQPRSIDKSQLDFKVGEVDSDTMLLIEKASMVQLGIKPINICNNNQVINTNIDMNYAKELLLSINQLDKLSQELNKPISAKEILVKEFISYCKKFGKDYKEITTQIKSMLPVKQDNRKLAVC